MRTDKSFAQCKSSRADHWSGERNTFFIFWGGCEGLRVWYLKLHAVTSIQQCLQYSRPGLEGLLILLEIEKLIDVKIRDLLVLHCRVLVTGTQVKKHIC